MDIIKNKFLYKYARIISLVAALVFICHPIQVNAVTYIIQRTSALAATFYLLSVLSYMNFRIHNKTGYYFLTMLFILLGMFTKENTASIPLMLVLVEITFFAKLNSQNNKKHALLLILLFIQVYAIAYLTLFFGGINMSDSNFQLKASTDMKRLDYFFTELNVILLYIKIIFIPVGQVFDYGNGFPISHRIFDNFSYISLIIILLILVYAILNFKKNRLITIGILWFFIGLSIESSFIPIRDVYFEHRLYLSLVGFIIFLIGLISQITELRKHIPLVYGKKIKILVTVLSV